MSSTLPVGNLGEKIARKYLQKNKIKILKRNFRSPVGEIDLLARDKEDIVLVEVKTKSGTAFGHPTEMVNYYKQRKLIQLARYCQKLYPQANIRIDVIAVDLSVEPPKVEHFENAVLDEE